MKVTFAFLALTVMGIFIVSGLQACGKANGLGVGGKVIISGAGN